LVYQIPEEVVLRKSCQQGGPWKNTCHYQSQVSEQKSMKIYMEKEGGVNTKKWQKQVHLDDFTELEFSTCRTQPKFRISVGIYCKSIDDD